MFCFSEGEELSHIEDRKRNDLLPHITDVTKQQFTRIKLVKEALEIFEKESGARCMFKDEERKGLIIIIK